MPFRLALAPIRAYIKFLLMYKAYLRLQVFMRKLYIWSAMLLSFFKSYFIDHFCLQWKLSQPSTAVTRNQYSLKFDYFIWSLRLICSIFQKTSVCLWMSSLLLAWSFHTMPCRSLYIWSAQISLAIRNSKWQMLFT